MEYIFIFLGGAVLWTLTEYLVHRFMGHVWTLRTPFRREHQKHHHKRDYFASVGDKVKATLAFGWIPFAISYPFAGTTFALVFTAGFILMYLYYEYLHKIYHVAPPKNPIGAFMRKHHMYHHFVDDTMNHGVSVPIWDFVFRTYKSSRGTVPINNKFSMNWLFEDSERKVVKPMYSADYAVVEKTRCT